MPEPIARSPLWGFRISITDALVLLAAVAGALLLRINGNLIWWVIATVVGHFFLFCNVIRLRRSFEMTWAVLFILNIALCTWLQNLSSTRVLTCQLPITALLVILELRSPRYHGILAPKLNPHLYEYLKKRRSS